MKIIYLYCWFLSFRHGYNLTLYIPWIAFDTLSFETSYVNLASRFACFLQLSCRTCFCWARFEHRRGNFLFTSHNRCGSSECNLISLRIKVLIFEHFGFKLLLFWQWATELSLRSYFSMACLNMLFLEKFPCWIRTSFCQTLTDVDRRSIAFILFSWALFYAWIFQFSRCNLSCS